MARPSVDRRDQILEAFVRCLIERGFHLTSMDDIARQAGVSAGLIYRHFKGKSEMILALVKLHGLDMRERIKFAETCVGQQALAIFFGLGDFDPDCAIKEGIIHLEVLAEAARNPAVATVIREVDRDRKEALEKIIRQAHSLNSGGSKSDPASIAELLLTLADGLEVRMALANKEDLQPPPCFDQTLEALFDFLLGLPSRQ